MILMSRLFPLKARLSEMLMLTATRSKHWQPSPKASPLFSLTQIRSSQANLHLFPLILISPRPHSSVKARGQHLSSTGQDMARYGSRSMTNSGLITKALSISPSLMNIGNGIYTSTQASSFINVRMNLVKSFSNTLWPFATAPHANWSVKQWIHGLIRWPCRWSFMHLAAVETHFPKAI